MCTELESRLAAAGYAKHNVYVREGQDNDGHVALNGGAFRVLSYSGGREFDENCLEGTEVALVLKRQEDNISFWHTVSFLTPDEAIEMAKALVEAAKKIKFFNGAQKAMSGMERLP